MVGMSNSVQPESLLLPGSSDMVSQQQPHCSTQEPKRPSKRRSGVEGMGLTPGAGVQDAMGSQLTHSSYNSSATEDTLPCTVRACWQEHKPTKKVHKTSVTHSKKSEALSEGETGGAQGVTDTESVIGDDPKKRSRSTITRGLLSTSGFVWVPLCRPSITSRNSSMGIPDEVVACSRLYMRRNALADPMQMALPQDTRERIQKEVEDRKSSFTRKVSQYFKAMYSDDYEVDLI